MQKWTRLVETDVYNQKKLTAFVEGGHGGSMLLAPVPKEPHQVEISSTYVDSNQVRATCIKD
jgi:hypothetical protein